MPQKILVRLLVLTFLLLPRLSGQERYVGRFDAFAGFGYLNSPHIDLSEYGFHMQVGVRPKLWYSLGFDYSISTGNTSITPGLLTTPLQQQLGVAFGQLSAAGLIPPNYALSVPIDSTTQTFAAGPQFACRHWRPVTLFIRPSVGAIHETATPHGMDPIANMIIAGLVPSGKKRDWTPFYGFGGGVDLNITRIFSFRIQADLVHDHLFNDLLKDSRNTVRISFGPAIQWGHNIAK